MIQIPIFPELFPGRFGSGKGGISVPWYLPTGIGTSDLVGRYQAIGAVSYAASKVNLASPGTHDLAEGAGAVTWTTENGWSGNADKYFTTDIVPTKDYTVFVHFSDITLAANGLFGCYVSGKGFYMYEDSGWLFCLNTNNNTITYLGPYSNGVVCLAGGNIYVNGTLITTLTPTWDGTAFLSFMATIAINKLHGKLKSALVYNKTLNATQVATVTTGMLSLAASIYVSSPKKYQVFQRSGVTGTISIAGTVYGRTSACDIEASWNGGAYTTIASNVTGAFTGSLTNQAQGQGSLILRIVGTTITTTIYYVGIGDIFIIAGQSNASGRGTGTMTYSHASLKAGQLGNDYWWKEFQNKQQDWNQNQVDAVSLDTSYGMSVWVPVTTSYLADIGIPVGFVPCPMGSTTVINWQPGANHQDRTTLYGSMIYRALQTGAMCVLWWQGESDAANAMTQATYNAYLDTIANAVNADLGVKLMACKLQSGAWTSQANQDAINAAIVEAQGDNANVLTGPDLTGLTADNNDGLNVHLISDANINAAAALWWTAIKTAFGW